MELVCFQLVDAGQNISVPIDRIDAVALARGYEREVDGNSLCSLIGACKQAVFSHQYPALDRPFRLVVIDRDFRILEESGERAPVIEGVVYGLHQLMSGIQFVFSPHNDFPETLYEGLRFSAPHGQSEGWRLVFYIPLNLVEFSVDIEHRIAHALFSKFRFEVFAPGVSVASSFDSLAVLEQCVEAAGGVSLNDAFEVLEKVKIFVEREIGRAVEYGDFALRVANVGGNFALADVVFVLAVLNFNGRVVGFDDVGFKQFLLEQVIQQGKRIGCELHPVTLRRARNYDIVSRKDLLLAVVRKAIIELANDYFAQEARTGVAARDGRARFFGCDDVVLAFRAGTSFLAMVEDFQAGAHHLELMCEQVADENGFDIAIRANRIFGANRVWNRFMRQMLGIFEYMFNAGRCLIFSIGASLWFPLRFSGCRAGVVFLSLFSIVTFVAFFRLSDQDIELSLQFDQKSSQLRVAVQGLFQLFLELGDSVMQGYDGCPQFRVFSLEPRDFLAI